VIARAGNPETISLDGSNGRPNRRLRKSPGTPEIPAA
jgi:hypothetical protein